MIPLDKCKLFAATSTKGAGLAMFEHEGNTLAVPVFKLSDGSYDGIEPWNATLNGKKLSMSEQVRLSREKYFWRVGTMITEQWASLSPHLPTPAPMPVKAKSVWERDPNDKSNVSPFGRD
jgi:hypothetical protein